MSKELEDFNRIMETYGNTNSLEGTYDEFLTIKKALQELQAIKNSKPSKALEKLEKIGHLALYESYNELQVNEVEEFNFVKQALLKGQEQEKVIKILSKKQIYLDFIYWYNTCEEYNNNRAYCGVTCNELTEEEFDLLKKWFK